MTPIQMPARSKEHDRGSSLSGIAGSNPAVGMGPGICCDSFALSSRGLSDGPIPRIPTEYLCGSVSIIKCNNYSLSLQ